MWYAIWSYYSRPTTPIVSHTGSQGFTGVEKKVPSLKAEDNHLKQHPRQLKSVIFGHRYVSNRDLSQHIFFLKKNTFWNVSWNIKISYGPLFWTWEPLRPTGVFSLVVIGGAWVHCCGIRGCFSHEAHLSYCVRFGGNDGRELFVCLIALEFAFLQLNWDCQQKSAVFYIFDPMWDLVKTVVSSEGEWLWRPSHSLLALNAAEYPAPLSHCQLRNLKHNA